MFDRLFKAGRLEKKVIEQMDKYLNTLYLAVECLNSVLIKDEENETYCIESLEREADVLKREIISTAYEGAFLPYIRQGLCNFIEVVEKAFEFLKVCAFEYRYLNKDIYKHIKPDCLQVAKITLEMCEILKKAFEALKEKDDLREKALAIRVCEKQIDEIKLEITNKLRKCSECVITSFWEGKNISEFVDALVKISDVIEDASDYLYILDLSLK